MRNNFPLVSAIITNYNYEVFIGDAIKSVLSQTYSKFELIIVDDGSTDNSRDIIESFNDSRIKKIYQDNRGQASALNEGLRLASGSIVALLDSDDLWKDDKLDICVKAHLENEDVNIVQHNLEIISSHSEYIGRIHPDIQPGKKCVRTEYLNENHTGFFSSTSGITFKVKYLDSILPLDNSWKICADVAITRPLALFEKTLTLYENPGYYRIHDNNNWMNSEDQKSLLKNQQIYVDYTND